MISKKRIWMKQQARMRKIRRRIRVNKHIARYGYNRRPQSKDQRNKGKNPYYTQRTKEVFVPEDFSVSNISGVVNFIRNSESQCSRKNIQRLTIKMDNVVKIDMYAINLFLSFLNRLSSQNIRYIGTYPNNAEAKHFLINSGFLDLVQTNIKTAKEQKRKNMIFMVGKDSVDSRKIGKAVRESMLNIVDEEIVYPPLYEDLLEISANSVEHANENQKEKNWLVSIFIEEDKLHFIVTDMGLGIMTTIKKKFVQQVHDTMIRTDAEILLSVFKKKYQSMTGEVNRHKGLPIIYESYTDGMISDLQVLTNKVFYRFNTNTCVELQKSYDGVLYSWTIDKNNYENWKNSL